MKLTELSFPHVQIESGFFLAFFLHGDIKRGCQNDCLKVRDMRNTSIRQSAKSFDIRCLEQPQLIRHQDIPLAHEGALCLFPLLRVLTARLFAVLTIGPMKET